MPSQPPSSRRATRYTAIGALYAITAVPVIIVASAMINPDGVSYIQIARHYAAGDFDLAVNSYWGPLISWALVPFVVAGVDPVIAFKLLDAAFGLATAVGVRAVAGRLAGPRAGFLGFCAMLMLVLRMLPAPLSPDLLLSCVMTWYFLAAMRFAGDPGPGRALVTGALGGLAYLTKPYALAFVLAHALTLALLGLALGRSSPLRRTVRTLPILLGGLVIVAGPWVAAISAHDGGLTFGSVGRIAALIADRQATGSEQSWVRVQAVREGRLTVWENPVEIQDTLAAGPPPVGALSRRLDVALGNVAQAVASLRTADGIGLLLLGWVVSLGVLLARWRDVRTGHAATRLVLVAAVGLYVAGYLPLWVEMRYYWPIWGLMLALSLDVAAATDRRRTPAGAGDGGGGLDDDGRALRVATPPLRETGTRLRFVLEAALIACVAVQSSGAIVARSVRGEYRNADFLRDSAPSVGRAECLVSNEWEDGLHAAFWSGVPFLGQVRSRDPRQIAADLSACTHGILLVFDDAALAGALERTTGFRLAALEHSPSRSLHVFQRDTTADAGPMVQPR